MVSAVVVRAATAGLRGAVRKRLPGFLADRDCVLRRWSSRRSFLLQCLGRLNGFFSLRLRVGCL